MIPATVQAEQTQRNWLGRAQAFPRKALNWTIALAKRADEALRRRVWTAIKSCVLGKSSDAYMKQFTGSDEYWDRVIAVQREWHSQQPAPPDATAEFEPVHGWTKRQLANYLARNPDYKPNYEAKLQAHNTQPHGRRHT